MSTVIKPKRSETSLSVPSYQDLEVGEIAINIADKKIYIKDSNNNIVTINEVLAPGSDITYVFRSNNLSDLEDASAARTNLGVDSSAEVTDKSINNGIVFAIALG